MPEPLLELATVMRLLRERCPWKAEQTHASLARYLLEETHETLEAIDRLDGGAASVAHLREELGDLLLQVHFHAAVAEQAGWFSVHDVARGLLAKLYRRNPHVFGPGTDPHPQTPEEVDDLWQQVKATERTPAVGDLPETLPALLQALKVLERVSRTPGHPLPPPAAAPGGRDVEDGTDPERALGDRLLSLVAQARADGVDPEQALRRAVRRLTAAGEARPTGQEDTV